MYYRVPQRLTGRIVIALTICTALLPTPQIWLLAIEAAQSRREVPEQKAQPRPGKPEGLWPNLDDIRKESRVERQPPPPIASTIRSKKNTGKPWDGRRVGDPWPQEKMDQVRERGSAGSLPPSLIARRNQRIRHAHAWRRVSPSPLVLDNQFVQNFFSGALLRNPFSDENTYWYDHLRVAYGQGQEALKLAAIEFGRTLFESAEYAARNRDNHWYVYDLYKTYLMRDPDSTGWANWEAAVPTYGREYVRRGFEESAEFATLISNLLPNGSPTSNAASLTSARVDPRNQPDNGMLTRDASWSVPLLSLRGRAGLDLGLSLSYSSMVWTRSGPYIYFDEDNGFPSPGFRLGFPTVQRKFFDAQTARNVYLLITAAGKRVELRQVGSSNIYEAADSSYLRLTDNGSLLVQSTNGASLTLTYFNGEYHCTQVKDRNGNYLTINYNSLGQITTIVDTLARLITFNYDGNANLLSITQSWAGQPSHQWVSFGWSTRTMQYSFSDPSLRGVIGTANGTVLPVITQVALNDTSRFTFDYTNSLQLSEVRNYFDPLQRNATSFTYETSAGDVPRLLDSHVSALNWTGINDVPSQVITQYSVGPDGACIITAPDGTIYKQYYGTGWQKGLTTLSEVWSGGVRRKWITTAWTQDDLNLGYQKNPRPIDISVYDEAGNRRRVETIYTSYNLPNAVALPTEVKEYAADGTTVLRRTTTTYYSEGGDQQLYIDRRVLGLLREVIVYDGSNQPQSKVWYDYDWGNEYWEATPQPATQHEASGTARGRGNLCWIGRWDVTDVNNFDKHTRSLIRYNRTGSVIKTEDHLGHGSTIGYTDSFSDTVNRNTFAYATTVTDADSFSSSAQYNYDIGATTRTQTPAPAGQTQGAIHAMTYNNLGQLERDTTVNTGAYTRYVYGSDYLQSFATVNNIADEAYTNQVFDGLGRIMALAGNHPGSTGGYKAQLTVYDLMGRARSTSNPTEITSLFVPTGDDAAGWLYTQQSYDWQGRPLVTTNPDGTTKEASYAGCGCAGGTVVTLTDEGTVVAGVTKKRQTKIYSDVLGRSFKTELLNWAGGSPYSTTVNTYNARDQITNTKQYAGAEAVGNPFRETTANYDGYGRLQSRHIPQEAVGTATTWTYNADDTVSTITDARGAVSTYGYEGTNRRLVKTITHTLTGKPTINIAFNYDGAGNRTSMTDATGTSNYGYDQLSRLKSEARPLGGTTYTLSYEYNLADQVNKMTYPGNMSINYIYDPIGQVISVTGSDTLYQGITQYASNFSYRASGARKTMTDGANRTSTITYNALLRPATFQIDGGIVNQSYEYYNDGSLRFVHNVSDSNFDRFYEYDQVGRLTYATTGGAARGDLGVVPYYETFGYNAWSDTTSRFTETWSQDEFTDVGTFTNGRRDGWGYEADGNIKTIDNRNYSYDAAGNRVLMAGQLWTGFSYVPSNTASAFDGDGQRMEEVLSYPSSFTTRYLRSSVLGGEIAQDINSAGQTTSYIYLPDGTHLATLLGFPKWRHETPAGTGLYENYQSGFVNRVEFDPVRANVGLTAPPPPDTNGGDGDIGGNHNGGPSDSRFSDMSNPAAGCYSVGGVDLPCTWSSLDIVELIFTPAKNAAVAAPAESLATWVPPKRVVPINIPNPFDQFVEDPVERVDTTYTPGYWKAAPAPLVNVTFRQTGAGRNSENPNAKIISLVDTTLSSNRCRDFMRAVLRAASTKNNQVLHGGDIELIFDDFLGQSGGLSRSTLKGAPYGSATGTIGKDGTIYTNFDATNQDRADASTIINELPHIAGTKGGWPRQEYDDFALAQATHSLSYGGNFSLVGNYPMDKFFGKLAGRPKNPFADPTAKQNRYDSRWSNYFHNILRQECVLPQ
jgi:YD repeat-containing protein